MARSTEVLKFMVIQSPISLVTEENLYRIFKNAQTSPSGGDLVTIKNIRRRLDLDDNQSVAVEVSLNNNDPSKEKESKFEQNLLKRDSMPQVKSADQLPKNHNLQDDLEQKLDFIKPRSYEDLYLMKEVSKQPKHVAKPIKNNSLHSILQEIGELKKSIHNIRQKISKNSNESMLSIKTSEIKKQKDNKYDFSHQNKSYTNYRDLSNRGKSNHSYDRWKSHNRNKSFNDHIAVHEFVIDANELK